MSFVNPILLAALPLMSLPIVIHLINQNRHRTMPWGAMMFLVTAKRMTKRMERLRHVLIMLMRMLAIGALIFAVSRPLARGRWTGAGIGKTDTTLILLDRSVSMEAKDLQAGESKRSTALKKLSQFFRERDHGTHLVLIDGATGRRHTLDSTKGLTELPLTDATATSADIPRMLEAALDYLKANDSGRADIWICSDLSENDWDCGSGRWAAIRREFARLEGVQIYLLSYADAPAHNLSVRVANVQRRGRDNAAELVLDVMVQGEKKGAGLSERNGPNGARYERTRPPSSPPKVPVQFTVGGVRSVVEVQVDARGGWLQGHTIPIDPRLTQGWGSVGLPNDSNPQDNRFYFVFSEPATRTAVIVSDDPRTGETFRRAAAIPASRGIQHGATVIPVSRVGEIDWESTGLLIWQAPLPDGLVAEQVRRFVGADRVVLFFPPNRSEGRQLFGSRWGDWQDAGEQSAQVRWWRGDADLLAHADSGAPLPLSELRIYQYCALRSPGTPLARLDGDKPLIVRVATDRGGVYFCQTLPTARFSSLERDGVVFYVMLQRALAEGSRPLASASGRDAGPDALADRSRWQPVAPAEDAPLVSQRGLHAGVYRDGEYWRAVNRSLEEDQADVASVEKVDGLFAGLSYKRIEDRIGDSSALAAEIWRTFLFLMMLALILEAVLSLSGKKVEPNLPAGFNVAGNREASS